MKTALACVCLCIAALLLGKRQQACIVDLEQRIGTAKPSPGITRHPDREPAEADYRSKYRERDGKRSAAEVFEAVLSVVQSGRSVVSGPEVVMANREAFQAIRQLDLAGQKELIRLIARSEDPRLGSGRDSLYKCELTNVCLCAMADRHPKTALEILRRSDERIGGFYRHHLNADAMIAYVVRRLCELNPTAGLDALVEESNKSPEQGSNYNESEILVAVAENEPDLALETIPRLRFSIRIEPLRRILENTDSDEECTRRFQLLRHRFPDDPKALETTVQSLLMNVSKRNPSWRKRADWLEALALADDEKIRTAGALAGMGGDNGVDGVAEPTKWLADYMPPSKERDFILWRNASRGVWMAEDPDAANAFLRANAIDEEEMRRLENEGFPRAY